VLQQELVVEIEVEWYLGACGDIVWCYEIVDVVIIVPVIDTGHGLIGPDFDLIEPMGLTCTIYRKFYQRMVDIADCG
jgi:hypothetical protein